MVLTIPQIFNQPYFSKNMLTSSAYSH